MLLKLTHQIISCITYLTSLNYKILSKNNLGTLSNILRQNQVINWREFCIHNVYWVTGIPMKNSDIFYPEEKHNGSITILDQIFRLIFL